MCRGRGLSRRLGPRRRPLAMALSAAQADEAGCRVLTLGSQALGVPGPGSDVDCVAMVPYFVERHQFFAADGVAVSLRAASKASILRASIRCRPPLFQSSSLW